jgi:hypothetical protein
MPQTFTALLLRAQVLRLLGLPEKDMALLVRDKEAARIHVSFMGKLLLPEALSERIRGTRWTHVVAFRPTGAPARPSGQLAFHRPITRLSCPMLKTGYGLLFAAVPHLADNFVPALVLAN